VGRKSTKIRVEKEFPTSVSKSSSSQSSGGHASVKNNNININQRDSVSTNQIDNKWGKNSDLSVREIAKGSQVNASEKISETDAQSEDPDTSIHYEDLIHIDEHLAQETGGASVVKVVFGFYSSTYLLTLYV
jgi:hypothetical protein